MKTSWSTTILLVASLIPCKKIDYAPLAKSTKSFIIYDAMHYDLKPDLTATGLHKINLVSPTSLVSADPNDTTQFIPDPDRIRSVAKVCLEEPDIPVTLDIENWHYGVNALPATIEKLVQVIHIFREVDPAASIGYYGVIPNNKGSGARVQPAGGPDYVKWQQLNDQLKPVGDAVNIMFPAAYTFSKDTTGWKQYAAEVVAEARRCQPQKPVYVYIHPQYHRGTPLGLQFVDGPSWRCELETLYRLADGCVIWSSNNGFHGHVTWDEDAPFWKETKAFIARHHLH